MANVQRLDLHVVTHTHWDREWYHTAGRFRQRLVVLIDELLATPPDPGECFLLDGQAIVLEDYLAVRPGRASELSDRLRAGTLEAGPWYVLADELIPGGESLVRNLLAGRRMLEKLRAVPTPVLYCPDSFGHPAALPTIAAGFGMSVIVLWRGLGGMSRPVPDAVRWVAPDGSEALVYHLAPSGYELGSSLPLEEQAARERWFRIREELLPRAATGVALLPNGADHHALQSGHADALAAIASAAAPHRLISSSLRAFAEALTAAADPDDLETVAGELRDSYGYTWSLQGTFAARAGQKRRAATAERLLLRDAEPWAALARRKHGADRRHLIHAAWRSLLQCHPHDTLCGCSTDAVARAMDARLEDAMSQARGVRHDALLDLAGHDPVTARELGRSAWQPVALVRNPAAHARGGVAEIEIDTFIRDVPVGPGSGVAAGGEGPGGIGRAVSNPAALPDEALPWAPASSAIAFQTLSRERVHSRTESPRHYPDNDLVERARVVAWMDPLPGYGVRAIPLAPGRARPPWPAIAVSARGHTLDNGLVRVEAGPNMVTVSSTEAPGMVARFIGFEDVGEKGDLYTHSPEGERRHATLVRARLGSRGPLRAELETVWRMWIVPSGAPPAAGSPSRRRVLQAGANADFTVTFSLDAGAAFTRVRVRGENPIGGHRLRIVFASGLLDPTVTADAAFGPVERRPIAVPRAATGMELPPPTAPLHRHVSLHGRDSGLTIISDGLAEYEAFPDGGLAVTLVRAVSELSRNDLTERPGHAGWPVPTPAAQCLGFFAAAFAMFPHGPPGAATGDAIERATDDVLLPLSGTTLRSALDIPPTSLGVELLGTGLALSAIKDSEDDDWLVVRCVNQQEDERPGRWTFGFPVREARLARLDETPLNEIPVENGTVPFVATPRAVVTILVR